MDLIELIKAWCCENGIGTKQMITDLGSTSLFISGNIPLIKSVIRRLPKYYDQKVKLTKKKSGCSVTVDKKGINDSKDPENNMDYKSKIDNVFESQYKFNLSPTSSNKKRSRRGRNGRPVKEEQYKTYVSPTDGLKKKSKYASGDPKKSSAPKVEKIEATIKTTVDDDGFFRRSAKFKLKLDEALDGMATETSVQPNEYLNRFVKALDLVGQEQGIGSVMTLLKQRGIHIETSRDRQSLVLYVINAETKAKQGIKLIPLSALENNNSFQEELFNCIDLANNKAPGTFKQEQETLRDKESAVREVVSKMGPDQLNVDSEETGTKIARNQ